MGEEVRPISHNGVVAPGKRAGSRRGAKPRRQFRPVLLAIAAGVTLAVVAWGYLVFAAIDFGTEARAGNSGAWWLLILASIGAVACLFVGLMLVAQLSRALGITQGSSAPPAVEPEPDPLSTLAATQGPSIAPRHAGPSASAEQEHPPKGHDPDPPTGGHHAIR